MATPAWPRRTGLTLVEMLVVIALLTGLIALLLPPLCAPRPALARVEMRVVIARMTVLIALLLPTLSAAREAARSAACLSNLRQLAAAAAADCAAEGGAPPH